MTKEEYEEGLRVIAMMEKECDSDAHFRIYAKRREELRKEYELSKKDFIK